MMFKTGKKISWLRLLISLILIAYVISLVEINRLLELLSSIRFPFFFLALSLDILERILVAYKWHVLLATKRVNLVFSKAVKICFVSTFIGTFLPSSVGGDIVRAYSLYKHGAKSTEAISSVFVERIIGLLSSLLVASSAMLFLFHSKMVRYGDLLPPVLMTIVLFSLFLFLILSKSTMQFFIRKFKAFNLPGVQRKLEELYNACIDYKTHKWTLFYVLILSFLFQLVRVLITYTGSLALNQSIDIVYFFIFVPIIILVTVLPISVAGIGVREGAFVYFFSQVGMSPSEAFTLSLLLYAVSIIALLPGGLIYVMEGVAIKGGEVINREKTRV